MVGWRLKTLVKPNGDELIVRADMLVDAWLRVVLDGAPPNLPPDVSRFIADARIREVDGEVFVGLKHECRAIWFPDEFRSPMQRLIDADEAALMPDPPAPLPQPTRPDRVRGGSSRP